jgi:lipopolysaccharide export system protein LptC
MSKVIGILRRSRRLGLLIAMIAVLAVVGISLSQTPDALAATRKPSSCVFYSDSTYTVQVGEAYYTCYNTMVLYGSTSSYKICDYDYCCGTSWC